MWAILENKFHYICFISISQVYEDICNITLFEYKDIINYINCYKIVFDKLLSLINKKSWMFKKIIEKILQKNFLQYLKKNYFAFLSVIIIT